MFDQVKDSGKRFKMPSGAVRDTAEGKGRYDLISTIALKRLAQHYENGAKKYGDRNWEIGLPAMRYLDSAMRHLQAVIAGQNDEDHASAVSWNMFAFIHTLEMVRQGKLPAELDNRPYTKEIQ